VKNKRETQTQNESKKKNKKRGANSLLWWEGGAAVCDYVIPEDLLTQPAAARHQLLPLEKRCATVCLTQK
jgi:hypothetical protein